MFELSIVVFIKIIVSLVHKNLQMSILQFTNIWTDVSIVQHKQNSQMIWVSIVPTYQDLQMVGLSCLNCCVLSTY